MKTQAIWAPLLLVAACDGSEAGFDTTESLIAEEMVGDHPACERPHRDLSAADSDGDGTLSEAEREAFRAARRAEILAAFDADEDGSLSPGERAVAKAARRQARFDELDADASGGLSPAEVEEACRLAARFDEVDTDGDGVISAAEFGDLGWSRPPMRRRSGRS